MKFLDLIYDGQPFYAWGLNPGGTATPQKSGMSILLSSPLLFSQGHPFAASYRVCGSMERAKQTVLMHSEVITSDSGVVAVYRQQHKYTKQFKHQRRLFVKKVKFCHTRYWALGPELIPVYRQSACRWLFKSSVAVGWHYFSPRLQSPSQPKNVTVPLPVPRYIAWWQRHIGANNLPKVVMQLCPCGNWTRDLARPMPYH